MYLFCGIGGGIIFTTSVEDFLRDDFIIGHDTVRSLFAPLDDDDDAENETLVTSRYARVAFYLFLAVTLLCRAVGGGGINCLGYNRQTKFHLNVNLTKFLISLQPPQCWKTVFKIAATVHLIGCTFYAIFASGELQPWAEPKDEEQKVWTPTTGAGLGTGAYMKETSFVSINSF